MLKTVKVSPSLTSTTVPMPSRAFKRPTKSPSRGSGCDTFMKARLPAARPELSRLIPTTRTTSDSGSFTGHCAKRKNEDTALLRVLELGLASWRLVGGGGTLSDISAGCRHPHQHRTGSGQDQDPYCDRRQDKIENASESQNSQDGKDYPRPAPTSEESQGCPDLNNRK